MKHQVEDGHGSSVRNTQSPVRCRFPLQRFGIILNTLKEGETTTSKLAEILEVSSKTIQRDLEFLRYRLDFPIESDWKGIHLSAPIKGCPLCAILNTDKESAVAHDREMLHRILATL